MLSCKEATKLVSENLDRDLPLGKRIRLRLHVMMCKGCSAYRRQVESLNTLVSSHYRHDQGVSDEDDLSEDAVERIKKSLHTDRPHPG